MAVIECSCRRDPGLGWSPKRNILGLTPPGRLSISQPSWWKVDSSVQQPDEEITDSMHCYGVQTKIQNERLTFTISIFQ
ncbi:hypothetical protein ATANTOWER_006957 [Ataeniobius toweri]|uniref:Uncharacterized protein n=1 Tax=Ataeniobius toweri TaxID=208326 RepID=A0ABU7B580_9TELE|nr:hypothetical protein [Ataeniobius toweri]